MIHGIQVHTLFEILIQLLLTIKEQWLYCTFFFFGGIGKSQRKKTYLIHCYCLLLPIHWNGILRFMLTFPTRIYGTPNEFIYFHVTGDRIRESIFGSIFSRCLYWWLQHDRGVYRLLLHTRPVHHLLVGDSGYISLERISPQHPDGRYSFLISARLRCG